jgi:hypothetical protein
MAMLHGAMFDAAKEVDGPSKEAAVHAAARGVLAGMYRSRRPR